MSKKPVVKNTKKRFFQNLGISLVSLGLSFGIVFALHYDEFANKTRATSSQSSVESAPSIEEPESSQESNE